MAQPGDVVINKCLITSPRGSLDLTNSFLSGRVFESIFAQSVICAIDVFDTDDAIGNLQLLGDEMIAFNFNAPGTQPLDYNLALDKVEFVSVTGTQKGKQYILHGVGQETLQAKSNFIQKAYSTDISSIVTDIHKNFLQATTKIITEVTDGIQNLIIPNLKPFEAIDMVRRRATSSQNKSSTFLFFENSEGHNFKTIEGLANGEIVKTFYHSDAVGNSVFNNTYNNIIDYEIPQIVSSTQRIALGGLSSQVATYDARTRQYTSNTVQPNLGNFNSLAFLAKYGLTAGIFNFLPIDTKTNPTHIPTSTPIQLAYLSNLLQCYINLKVNGDTIYKAGDKITLNIPESISTTGTPQLDPMISGDYLISRICRDIGKVHEQPRYTDNLECLTPSLASGGASS